ncbi:MAG: hypothetical protein II970_07335 [Paludibacteraceae bacterium]|nr:hypothetical protein [Paludibacteraceae bacterium]
MHAKQTLYTVLFLAAALLFSCGKKPSKVEIMRQEKAAKDSTTLAHAQRTIAYSDSLLKVLLPQADSLLRDFRYEKAEDYEDHGRYVHHLLRTDRNTARNYLQAAVRDDRITVLQSFFYGPKPIHQERVRISAGDLYAESTGSNHIFEAEGVHEILSMQDDEAVRLLQFVADRQDERLLVTAAGAQKATYYLQSNEKKALAETYRLALVMRDIATLERAMHVAALQVQKYEKRQTKQQ